MGLDNGFYVVSNKRQLTRADLPSIIEYPFEYDYASKIEIVYWRKNWGLRDGVLDILFEYNIQEDEKDNYYHIDSPKVIKDIIALISSFLNPVKWEDKGHSIWEYNEIYSILIQNIINLAVIAEYMKSNPDIYLLFYDSY